MPNLIKVVILDLYGTLVTSNNPPKSFNKKSTQEINGIHEERTVSQLKTLIELNVKIYVVTGSNTKKYLDLLNAKGITIGEDRLLNLSKLKASNVIFTSDKTSEGKNSYLNYVMENEQISPEELLYIDDDSYAIESAGALDKNINTAVVTYPHDLTNALHLVIKSYLLLQLDKVALQYNHIEDVDLKNNILLSINHLKNHIEQDKFIPINKIAKLPSELEKIHKYYVSTRKISLEQEAENLQQIIQEIKQKTGTYLAKINNREEEAKLIKRFKSILEKEFRFRFIFERINKGVENYSKGWAYHPKEGDFLSKQNTIEHYLIFEAILDNETSAYISDPDLRNYNTIHSMQSWQCGNIIHYINLITEGNIGYTIFTHEADKRFEKNLGDLIYSEFFISSNSISIKQAGLPNRYRVGIIQKDVPEFLAYFEQYEEYINYLRKLIISSNSDLIQFPKQNMSQLANNESYNNQSSHILKM